MAKGRGRPRKTRDQKLKDALERTMPNDRVMDLRRLFSGIVQPPPEKRLEGRNGEIDSEICDAIGQLCALGLLDGHGHDATEMRDKGRFYGCHYAKLMKRIGTKTGNLERAGDGGKGGGFHVGLGAYAGAEALFDKMDQNLPDYERRVLLTLVVDPLIGHLETVPWAQSLIDEELLRRKRVSSLAARPVRFPDAMDRAYLAAAVRALVILVDGALPQRWERAA